MFVVVFLGLIAVAVLTPNLAVPTVRNDIHLVALGNRRRVVESPFPACGGVISDCPLALRPNPVRPL